MKITLTYDDGHRKMVWPVKITNRLPVAGDRMNVTKAFYTLGGEQYYEGDKLFIVGRTEEAPHHLSLSIGNLKVKGKDGKITVWTSIETCISMGLMEFVK